MKNLKGMEKSGLLKSKSYGIGKDKLWFLANHKEVKELGYIPPKAEIHAFKYDHEKDCADVFVSLAITEGLYEWQGEGDQRGGFRHDRLFRVCPCTYYLERERGSQGPDKLRAKIERYMKHYKQSEESFNVLFTVDTEPEIERLGSLFKEFGLGNSYQIALHQEFVDDPLEALISTRFKDATLQMHLQTHLQPDIS